MARPTKLYFNWRGRKCSIAEMAAETGIDRRILYYRLVTNGMIAEDAVKPPERPYTRYTLGGVQMPLEQIETALSFCRGALRHRARRKGTTLQGEIDKEYAEQRGGRNYE